MVNEGGIHVPLALRWSGHFSPCRRDETVHFVDVVPTLIEICHLKAALAAKPLDGASFAGFLSDGYAEPRLPELRFWQWNRKLPLYTHNAAVRSGDWKLVRPFLTSSIPKSESKAPPVLYHLGSDPSEENDVSGQNTAIRDRLLRELEQWSIIVEKDRISSRDNP